MGNEFQPELWRDLYVMLGTSSAALIGLLFVVTSLHLDEVMNNAVYRMRARNITLHLLAMLIQAAAILTPQPTAALGRAGCHQSMWTVASSQLYLPVLQEPGDGQARGVLDTS